MTGGEIAVNPAQLASDIKRMRETASVLRSRLQELYRYMEELDTMWEGAANHAFICSLGWIGSRWDACADRRIIFWN